MKKDREENLIWEKRGALIRGRCSLNISCQKVGANSREGLFRVNALFERSHNICIVYIRSSENQNVLLNVKSVLA